ncbi:hypothetical protein TVAG_396140 [Trichomonas vaginalis G3]|uniref:Uncharacterized protein n=1 Tax=Trichomonas vaginalis (strain ATCC PRA-98 / G3) TaxID=412133 RepID=A2ESC5_TRIV3|nr:Family A G protein-coupled receptor-like family [Trichomonas vaginalis G3]EAY04428.1 hypothetical protein TVAG_396140 [Trichomonas vaginalis G3]KAI5502214.1 Family A G protein-coupled receptor-like family [Trichomonas vaginalis G3]|eukprot:XP_001316651.1 hypothetical protein [Trichomonas vaginalis G3]
MSRALSDLIGPIGKQQRQQKLFNLLNAIEDKVVRIRLIFIIGLIFFGIQIVAQFLFCSSKLEWKSETTKNSLLTLLQCIFSFWTGVKEIQDLDYLSYSLVCICLVYYGILSIIIYFFYIGNHQNKISFIPFALAVVGLHVIIIPASYAAIAYIFSGSFTDHYLQFLLCIITLALTIFSTYIEYFIQYGLPKKDLIFNHKRIIVNYIISIFQFFVPSFNFYIKSSLTVGLINGISLAILVIYLFFQIKNASSNLHILYSLATIVGCLINIITIFVKLDGESYITFYLIMLNISFVIVSVIVYFTSEYILIPVREAIQMHSYQNLDKYGTTNLENIITRAAAKMDFPNELLDYLESRNSGSIIINEILFLVSQEISNEERMKKALDTITELKPNNTIYQVRLIYYENIVRPTFVTIRAQAILNDYSNTLGMFWNEIVNDNVEHLVSLSNDVANNYLNLTNIFSQYGKSGNLGQIYSTFCEITHYNTETENNNLTYALVSRSGNRNEDSNIHSHCTQYILVYIGIILYTFNLAMNGWAKSEVKSIWNASIDAYNILQSISAGSFITTLIKLNNSINVSMISSDVYDTSLFPTRLTNLTADLQSMTNSITNYTSKIKEYVIDRKFDGLIESWLVHPFNVTRIPSTVESSIRFLASSFQNIVEGGDPGYDGIYVKGTTDLVIFSAILDDTITSLCNYALKLIRLVTLICRIQMAVFLILGPILLWFFSHNLTKSINSSFQSLFKLSKTDLIQKTRELISWVKDSSNSGQQEDNNVRYNRELIISKTHTNSLTNRTIERTLVLKRTAVFLIFVAITWGMNELVWVSLKENATDIGISSYAYLLSQQMLKIGQLFLLSSNDEVYNSDSSTNSLRMLRSTLNTLQAFSKLSTSKKITKETLEKIKELNSMFTISPNLRGSSLSDDRLPLSDERQENEPKQCKAKINYIENALDEEENQRRRILEDSTVNETATTEMRAKHTENLFTMIDFARQMVASGMQKFSKNSPKVVDISLYITTEVNAPTDRRALFTSIDIISLNIFDIKSERYKTDNFDQILSQIITTSTMYTNFCAVSLSTRLDKSNHQIQFYSTLSAIISIGLIAFILSISTSSGTYWLSFNTISKSIISTMPKFDTNKGQISTNLTLSTREEEMKKSSAVVIDLLNSEELRDDLLENHILLNSQNVIIRSSMVIEEFLSAPPLEGMKFDDAIKSIANIIPNDGTDENDVDKILFHPKDEKKKDVVMEALKYKLDGIELDCGRVNYVCVIRDKTREYESTRLWRNELNQLKLLGLQFIPPEVYEALAGEESFSSIQVNNAFVATFYINKLDSIDIIEEVKTIVIKECKEYQHLWPVARSTMAIKIYSALLDQNISHFRALITLLCASLKISKRITELGCEPHCVVSKVKATHASFGLDFSPVFDMRDDNPYDLILAMGSPAHKISISRDPYEILYNTGIPIEFSFYFRTEGFHKISYDTIQEIETIIEREQAQLAIV